MSDQKIDDRIHAELLALQDLAVGDIAFYKQQQWQICNHALALDAALVAVVALLKPLGSIEVFLLCALAFSVLVAGVLLIREMGKSLAKGRDRLPALRKHFDRETSLRAYAAGDDPSIALLSSKEKASLEKFFYFVLGLAFGITVWVVFRLA